jgi:uncharacterized membrane protein
MRYISAALALSALGLCFTGAPARADLKLCNNTQSRVGVAIGYKDRKGWASEGWWTVEPKQCPALVKGNLIARYYYIYATDYQEGGDWGGKSMLCVRDKIFTIRGIDSCVERGYKKVGFFEVDTGEEPEWTINLSGAKTNPPAKQ